MTGMEDKGNRKWLVIQSVICPSSSDLQPFRYSHVPASLSLSTIRVDYKILTLKCLLLPAFYRTFVILFSLKTEVEYSLLPSLQPAPGS